MATECVLCGASVRVPMADWDFPVCVGCEDWATQRHLTKPPPVPIRVPRQHALPSDVNGDLRRLVHVLAELMAAS